MILRAQQLVTQLMPTLVGDQVPIAAEALSQLQAWSRGLWGHDIQLVGDSATDTGGSQAETVPWNPPAPTRGPGEQAERHRPDTGDELWKPAGLQSQGPQGSNCSLDSEDKPGTETEDEAWGLPRRRRSATTSFRRRSTASTTEQRGPTTEEGAETTSHRRRRLHAAMADD